MGLRATIALAAALLVTGGAFDLASLYVPGVALAVLAGGAATWAWLATRGAGVERLPGPGTVVEGEPYPLRIRIHRGWMPPRGSLVDPLLDRPLPVSPLRRDGVRVGMSRSRATVVEEVRFERRGRHRLEPPALVLGDPLGLSSSRVEGAGGGEVLVLPRIEPVLAGSHRSGDDGAGEGPWEGAGAGLAATAGVEIDGLRPYRRGSPASRIHWPAVARHGELIERRLASGAVGSALVVLDARTGAPEEALDRAVRAAASLCVHLARSGGCTLVVSGSGRALRIDPELRGWEHAHAMLALVEPGGSLRGAARAAEGSATFWVAAGGGPPRGLPAGSYLVTASPPAGARPAFTVAGCGGLPVRAGRPSAGRTRAG